MIIYLDNIIFNLQRHGAESMQWAAMIRGLLAQRDAQLRFIEYRNAIANEYRYRLDIARQGHLYIMRNMWLTRHLAVRIDDYDGSPFIFHSSGCRICDNPNAVNVMTIGNSFKSSLIQSAMMSRCNCIICTSHDTRNSLPPYLRHKAAVISTRRNRENMALAMLKLYRQALSAKTHTIPS